MPIEIIAEIGKGFIDYTNPNQTIEEALVQAKRMVHVAKLSGADTAKFQTHVWNDEQKKRSPDRYRWSIMNEKLTPIDFWIELKAFCSQIGIEFLTTPMSKMAAEKVNHLVKRWKVSSADIVDFELLSYLQSTGKPIIISCGMSTPEEIDKAYGFLGDQIQYMNYCVSLYPCPVYKINFNEIEKLRSFYGKPIGFSDHSLSIEAPALAVRMGCVAVEKHFTTDRNLFGPDHKVSLLPEEFKKMAELCRLAEKEGDTLPEEKVHWERFRKVSDNKN